MHIPMHRSYLFVPGNRPDRFPKAIASGAHRVILDLEDGVSPAEKSTARSAVANWLTPDHPVFVRTNAADTPWFEEDLRLCGLPGVAGVMLPKAEGCDALAYVAQRAMTSAAILPLIETATGLSHAERLAACPGVQRLAFGSIDFQVDLGIVGDDELLVYRSLLVLASRLAQVGAPIDGICTTIDDVEQLRADTLRARKLGFAGKLCIHPNQVTPVNQCFLPQRAEIDWAERVIAASKIANGDAAAVDGKMIDRPVLLQAEALIREAHAQAR